MMEQTSGGRISRVLFKINKYCSRVSALFAFLAVVYMSFSVAFAWSPPVYNTSSGPIEGKINIHLVPHSHLDVGWLKTVDQCYMGSNNSIQVSSVQYVLDTLVEQLLQDKNRKFIFAEQAFFMRWWREQTKTTKSKVKTLVKSGQLEFVNGGWCMHDEASTHYVDMIDQTTLGHRYISENFGSEATPRIGWQIDPFGHSAVQAYLLTAQAGYDAVFFGRADYADVAMRRKSKKLEFVWRASKSLQENAQVFGGILHNHYEPPDGFNYEYKSLDPPIQDDPLLCDYNLEERVDAFVAAAISQSREIRTNHVMWTMGQDYCYNYAGTWFKNMDKLIHHVNLDGRVNAFYSTPSRYVDEKHVSNASWPLKEGDFFPYSDCPHCYWTGYFSSRPAFKGFVRMLSGYLQAARQLEASANWKRGPHSTAQLEDALALSQHHDAVSGTQRQHVAADYARRLHCGAHQAAKLVADVFSSQLFGLRSIKNPQLLRQTAVGEGSGRVLIEENDGPETKEFPEISLETCWLLNVSYCRTSETAVNDTHSLVIVAYNPLGWPRTEYIRIPMAEQNVVVTDSLNRPIESQISAISSVTERLRNLNAEAYLGEIPPKIPIFELTFAADIPPFGYATFFVSKETSLTENVAKFAEEFHLDETNGKDITVGSSDGLQLVFDTKNGPRLKSLVNKVEHLLQQSYVWYNGSDGNYFDNYMQTRGTQPSGAYVFRPNSSETFSVATHSDKGKPGSPFRVLRGPLVDEIHQRFSSWVSQVTRLYKNEPHVEMEFTIGPIPVEDDLGKEIVTKIATNISSGGVFFTDSNGRDYLKRVRNWRQEWELNVTEAVAGNYYPVNAGIFLGDESVQFSILSDRSVGGASLRDGELEVMLHRRLLYDDHRGVGEALNESVCVGEPQVCEGLVIRGKFLLNVSPNSEAVRWRRTNAQRQLSPILLSFGSLGNEGKDGVMKSAAPVLNQIRKQLPQNVALVTLQKLESSKFLIRLGHLYEVGEHAELSAAAEVDLALLFPNRQILEVTETTIYGSKVKSEVKPLRWRVEGDSSLKINGSNTDGMNTSGVRLNPMEIRTFVVVLEL